MPTDNSGTCPLLSRRAGPVEAALLVQLPETAKLATLAISVLCPSCMLVSLAAVCDSRYPKHNVYGNAMPKGKLTVTIPSVGRTHLFPDGWPLPCFYIFSRCPVLLRSCCHMSTENTVCPSAHSECKLLWRHGVGRCFLCCFVVCFGKIFAPSPMTGAAGTTVVTRARSKLVSYVH